MTSLNPEIFSWARSTAGMSAGEAARALGFSDTRERSAVDRLQALEDGEEEPSRSVLLRMARAYRRSLLVFYLPAPPRTGDRGQDFRTVPGAPPPLFNPTLDALIRDVRGRQTIVKALVEETDAPPVDFIGTASMRDSRAGLTNGITERLGFSLSEFRRQRTVPDSFAYLRTKIEDAGVYVLLLGNLGSHHTNITVETFRGFAIADPIAPFIVINDQDARAAWSFTALHELVHLWLGTTGVSGAGIEVQIEQFCNDIAGEILLPTAELRELSNLRRAPLASVMESLSAFTRTRRVSRAMVAYKLLRADLISAATWREVTDRLRQEWLATRERDEAEDKGRGGPSYYVLRRHRLGNALLDTVRRSLDDGSVTYTKAARVLGVKPRNVGPLLFGNPAPGGR